MEVFPKDMSETCPVTSPCALTNNFSFSRLQWTTTPIKLDL